MHALSHYFFRFIQTLIATAHGFVRDQCYLRASALTFYSLLSIVPVLAVAFGIAKGFGFEQHLEMQLREHFGEYDQLVSKVIGFAYSLLEHTQGGVVAGVGVLTLFWSVFRLLGNIEASFNQIWKVSTPRNWSQKCSDYLAALIICPLFFVTSSSLNLYITTQVNLASERSFLIEAVYPLLFIILKWIPFALSWILFTFIYLFMPNTRVRFKSGLFAGIIAGTAYQFLQLGYIYFQLKLSNYGVIYGSFAALPLFLIWLQLSWITLLAGAEFALFFQYPSSATAKLNFATKKRISLLLVHYLIQNFKQGGHPLTLEQLAEKAEIPPYFARETLNILIEESLISEIYLSSGAETGYQLAMDSHLMTSDRVCDALEYHNLN